MSVGVGVVVVVVVVGGGGGVDVAVGRASYNDPGASEVMRISSCACHVLAATIL